MDNKFWWPPKDLYWRNQPCTVYSLLQKNITNLRDFPSWETEHKVAYIAGLFSTLPTMPIYLCESPDGKSYKIVDGQERYNCLINFHINKQCWSQKYWDRFKVSLDLISSPIYRNKFESTPIHLYIFKPEYYEDVTNIGNFINQYRSLT